MILKYTIGEDLKAGDFLMLGKDGRMYKNPKRFGRYLLKDMKAGEILEVRVGGGVEE